MNFELLPIDETMQILRTESDSKIAFQRIIGYANKNLPSQIWKEYEKLNIERDIEEASIWLQKSIAEFPDSKGIYLGLDTLKWMKGMGQMSKSDFLNHVIQVNFLMIGRMIAKIMENHI